MKISWDLAEYSLLGAVLIGGERALEIARKLIRPEELKLPQVRACYESACRLMDAEKPIDVSVIQTEAQKNGCIVDNEYLIKAMDVTVTAANTAAYAEAVHDNWQLRKLQELGSRLIASEAADPKDVFRDAMESLQELQSTYRARVDAPTEAISAFYDYLVDVSSEAIRPFLPTGFKELDAALGGGMISPGVITLAARPGVGKSMMALNIAENVAAAGNPVLYASLEMSENQLLARRAGRLSGVSYNKIMRGDVKPENQSEWNRVTQAIGKMYERPLYIADKTADVADLEIIARSVPGLRLLVIDHMGLIKKGATSSSKLYEQVTATSHEILGLSKKLEVPILSLCQLNRESEGRTDKKPKLSDLRNSGAIEEDSDVVMLLHREAMYLPRDSQPPPWDSQHLNVDIAKNRHGATGEVDMNFLGITGSIWEG